MIIAECSTSGPAGLIVSARTGKSAKGNITEQHFRSDGMKNGHRRMSAYGEHECGGSYILDDYTWSRNHTKAKTIRRWKRNLKKKARVASARLVRRSEDD